jgi:hypothetical protein
MRSFYCAAAVTLAMACSYATAYASGTILLTRPINGVSNGTTVPLGSGLFTINDAGTRLRQVTPLMAGTYYMPSWLASQPYNTGVGYWLTKNLSPDGKSVLYFQNPSTDPADGPYSGKYYVKNLSTGAIQPLFAGSNDNAAPGYGYLSRDPVDGNTIAYTNSTSEYPVSNPCVYVMHADGSDQHVLWCAPANISVPNAESPPASRAVESLRWSGNGQKLVVYVSYAPPPLDLVRKKDTTRTMSTHGLYGALALERSGRGARPMAAAAGPVGGGTGYSALFVIDVASGTAVEVGANMVDPPSGDISYDGTKVIYQQYDYAQCGDEDSEALGASLCVKDLTTGTVTDLFLPTIWSDWGSVLGANLNWWAPKWYMQILLSPDGSQAVFTMQTTGGNEADLYTIRTDGTYMRRLTTSDPNPTSIYTGWTPVAWSPDGTRILANRAMAPVSGSTDQTWPSEVHIVNVGNGNDRLVTSGYAVDWLENP